MRLFACAAIAALSATVAHAAPVDLSTWTAEGGSWTTSGTNDTVFQSVNTTTPAVFFDGTSNAQNTALSGTISVDTTSDDDFIGFVLGYQANEINAATPDFWLIDWKQGDQGAAVAGLALSQVTTAYNGGALGSNFWDKDDGVTVVQRGANLGSTGWQDNQSYTFDLVFTPTLIEVFVDGVKEISYAGAFTDGAFGFYNFSQESVTYAGITQAPVSPVPLPAGLPLLLAGLGAMAGLSRRKSRG